MSTQELSKKSIVIGGSQSASQRKRVVIRRVEPTKASFISPIERWSDNNYAPYELDYLYNHKTESVEIVAPLHGFHPDDVHIDISRGKMIILLSNGYEGAFQARQEYYCEIPLASEVQQGGFYIEIGTSFLTIRLDKRKSVLKRAASAAYIFKNGFALLFGCNWNFGRLDD